MKMYLGTLLLYFSLIGLGFAIGVYADVLRGWIWVIASLGLSLYPDLRELEQVKEEKSAKG